MRTAATDTRNLILLGIAAVAGGFVAPGIPYLGLPLAAFALTWITYRFGVGSGIGVAALAGAFAALFGHVVGLSPLESLFVFAALLIVGPVTALALTRLPALVVLAGVALSLAAVFLATPVGAQTYADTVALLRQFFASGVLSTSATGAAATRQAVDAAIVQFAATWPSTVFYMMGLSALIVVPVASRAARALEVPVSRYPHLIDVDVSFHVVWPTILGIAALAVGAYMKIAWLGSLGSNVLMFVRPVLVLQGLGDFAALYRRAKAGRFMRGIGYVLLIAFELIIPSVSVLGLVDVFYNLRKLPRGGVAPATGDART